MAQCAPLPDGLGETVHGSGDSEEIEEIIRGTKAEFVLGSSLELPVARSLKIPHLVISAPHGGGIPLHKTYAGITGAYFLIEDYVSAIVRNNGHLRSGKRERLEKLISLKKNLCKLKFTEVPLSLFQN